MPAWGWLKYAPWGEIAKAAAKVPGLVRELRGGDDDESPPPPPRPPAESEPTDVEQQSRALAQELATISARLRTVTWIASVALIAALAAVATALLR
jgi:hypothetical protein